MPASPSPLITLTTDFGYRDGYAAAMKGAILTVCPRARVVDVTHGIDAHDVVEASQVLASVAPYFPPDTIHVAVVDPGVGSDRRPLLLVTPEASYVGPDNGIFTGVLTRLESPGTSPTDDGPTMPQSDTRRVALPTGCTAIVIDRRELWRQPLSQTFHGRDVFGPVAAHLGSGVLPDRIGTATDYVELLPTQPVQQGTGRIDGAVVSVDRFGNLVTNIRLPPSAGVAEIEIVGQRISSLSTSYAEADGLLAIVGSQGSVEIAWTRDSAARRLGAGVGTPVTVRGRFD